MEDLDRRIIEELSADSRMSYTDLGKALGMSTSAVHQRVRRLEQRGILKGYAAKVDPVALGLALTAFISVTPLDPAAPDDIPDRLRHLDAVRSATRWRATRTTSSRCARPLRPISRSCIATIRSVANVSTRTTVVLSTPWE